MERTTLNSPVIALRGLTVFPDLTMSFDVEREISIYALDNAMEACLRQDESEDRFIRVYIGILKKQLYICVTNSVGGEVKR